MDENLHHINSALSNSKTEVIITGVPLMIFIKFFSDDGFWIVWSIAIMKRTVLGNKFYLVTIFWTTKMSRHICNDMKVVLPPGILSTQLAFKPKN